MNTIIEKYSSVYQVELLTDDTEETTAFYKSLGFTPANEIGERLWIHMKHFYWNEQK